MSLGLLRFWTLVFPPAGLFLLWFGRFKRPVPARTKILGTLGTLLYSLLYIGGILWTLIRFDGLEIEWRGGYLPSFTFAKAKPDYARLEAHRKAQAAPAGLRPPEEAYTNSYWTSFRGPNRDGHYQEGPISTNWSGGPPRRVWHQPSGGGYASYVVAQGLAFTIEQRRSDEVVAAYELSTGREVWTNGWPANFQESMGGDGPRATPTWDAGRLYALGAEGELRCLEAKSGALVWAKNILADNRAGNVTYGMSGSPLVISNRVIVQPGGADNHSVAAYDKASGDPLWRALSDGAAYSSPMFVNLAGQPQILVVTASQAVGLEPEQGRLLWAYPWVVLHGNVNIAQPVLLSSNSFFLSAGYGTGCAAVEIQRAGNGFQASRLWTNKLLKNKFTSSVFYQGHIYGLDEDHLTCLEAATGKRLWREGRYGYGQLILAAGHLLILSGSGQLAMVPANPARHEEIFRFQAIEGKTWNHPALGGGFLLVRNSQEMACFDLRRR